MKTISINNAKAGDKLAMGLKADDGTMILSKGATISAPMIMRLTRMGIACLTIEGGEAEKDANTPIRLAALEKRFRGTENDPFLSEMTAIVRSHILGTEGEAAPAETGVQASPATP